PAPVGRKPAGVVYVPLPLTGTVSVSTTVVPSGATSVKVNNRSASRRPDRVAESVSRAPLPSTTGPPGTVVMAGAAAVTVSGSAPRALATAVLLLSPL